MEFVRFEAELSNRCTLAEVLKKFDGVSMKVIGFFETLKVKAAEAKSEFPARHDWDSFFRDAKNMNEMRPGERPDTVYLAYLPCKWFRDLRPNKQKTPEKDNPSEFVLRRIFETFGEVRCVDIPSADKFRLKMNCKTGIRVAPSEFKFGAGEVTFEAYVQFVEYISFVKSMDTLRNMKLVYVDDEGKATAANMKVDFDKSKHLCDKNIRRRRIESERLAHEERIFLEKKRAWEEEERLRIEAMRSEEATARMKAEGERMSRRRRREEKRRVKHLQRKRAVEEREIETKIKLEERKLMIAERKLQSMRLLTELLRRVELIKRADEVERHERELEEILVKQISERERLTNEENRRREKLLLNREQQLREKVLLSRKSNKHSAKSKIAERTPSRKRKGYKERAKSSVQYDEAIPKKSPKRDRMQSISSSEDTKESSVICKPKRKSSAKPDYIGEAGSSRDPVRQHRRIKAPSPERPSPVPTTSRVHSRASGNVPESRTVLCNAGRGQQRRFGQPRVIVQPQYKQKIYIHPQCIPVQPQYQYTGYSLHVERGATETGDVVLYDDDDEDMHGHEYVQYEQARR